MIELDRDMKKRPQSAVKIKVLGIGGAGGNTVNSMIDAQLADIQFVVANTDVQALQHSKAVDKVQLGAKATKGLGSGANPELGKRATEEDLDKIMDYIADADIVFIAAGMGGGTGSGGAPVIAKALKERGILSIAVVTKPFEFEGKRRNTVATEALDALKKEVDTLIVVPNQRLLDLVDKTVSMIQSFAMINEVLIHSVKSISDIITRSGHINVDFADLRAIMKGMGKAMMGTGSATGEDKAREAAQKAISSPLLENLDIKRAKGVLLNVTGGTELSLHEINDAASVIYDESNEDAHIILGSVIDPDLHDEVVVSVIATGFEQEALYATKVQEDYESKASEVEHNKQPEDQQELAKKTQEHCEQEEVDNQKEQYLQTVTKDEELLEAVEQELAAASEYKKQEASTTDSTENNLDVPAFLRNKHASLPPYKNKEKPE